MIIDLRTDKSCNVLNGLYDDKEYSDRLFDLKLQGWAFKKSPSNVIPGVWFDEIPYTDIKSISASMAKFVDVNPDKYAWWFALYSDETSLSIDFIYPWNQPKDTEKIVYGIDYESNNIYINSHCTDYSDDDFASLILETSIKHWAMKQHI